VKVDANAVINGPAYIGKNSIIGVNAFVRESFIGDNCVIGFSSEISRSYIGDDSWTHNNYVGDSIIGNNVSFGAGTLTGNLRFDEGEIVEGRNKLGTITGNNIRTGINCNLMPGIRIGSNSIISPGVNLAQDVPENSFVKAKTSTIVKENKLNIKPRK